MNFIDKEMVVALASLVTIVANAAKGWLVEVTKVLNSGAGLNAVDALMDTAKGVGHRLFGHGISYLPEISDKFGMKGVGQYFMHLFKDVMSPHGIPLPFAREIGLALGLSTGQTISWLCLNIGSIVSGGISVWHTTLVFDTLQEGLSWNKAGLILITASLKIAFSLFYPNPISLISGFADLALLSYYAFPVVADTVSPFLKDRQEKISDFLFPESLLEKIATAFTKATILCFAFVFVIEALCKLKKLLRRKITFAAYLAMITARSTVFALIIGVLAAMAQLLSDITGISHVYVKPAISIAYVLAVYFNRTKINKWLGKLDEHSERTANNLCVRAKGQWQRSASKSSQ